jgi:hypothetical protein
MKTIEQILGQKVISYNDIKLLKNRSNKEQKDIINYDNFEPIQIDSLGGAKGLEWLKSLLNSKGEPRKDVNLGYREIDIIKSATNEDFYFCGFYDAGNRYCRNYLPIYEVLGMEYIPYCSGEKIYIIG